MTIMMMRNIGMVGYVVAVVNIVALVVCLSSITPSPQQEAQFPAATKQATPPASAFTTVDAFTSSWTTTTTTRRRWGEPWKNHQKQRDDYPHVLTRCDGSRA